MGSALRDIQSNLVGIMASLNPFFPSCEDACKCEKCGEMYEADREHICRKKNSYPLREPKGETIQIKKWEYKENGN